MFNVCNVYPYAITIPLEEALELVETPAIFNKWVILLENDISKIY